MFGIRTATLFLVLTVMIRADVVTYEGDIFPEKGGWDRIGTFDADRFVVDGSLVIEVDLGLWAPPPGGEQEFYKREIPEFVGQAFFIEWRVVTDAPNTEIDGVGGSALTAVGGPVTYHFTIAEDRVRLIRDSLLPIVLVDIDPGTPHTYRLELYRDELYVWYIDGQIADSGVPEGDLPNADARITWGSKYWLSESRNEWDYVRFGLIPKDGSGDFDSDTQVALDDFFFVQECLSHSGPETDAGPGCRFADFNADNDVDLEDIADFQNNFTENQ